MYAGLKWVGIDAFILWHITGWPCPTEPGIKLSWLWAD
jgi:hypothetical protein